MTSIRRLAMMDPDMSDSHPQAVELDLKIWIATFIGLSKAVFPYRDTGANPLLEFRDTDDDLLCLFTLNGDRQDGRRGIAFRGGTADGKDPADGLVASLAA